jgi:hypothetical protein
LCGSVILLRSRRWPSRANLAARRSSDRPQGDASGLMARPISVGTGDCIIFG